MSTLSQKAMSNEPIDEVYISPSKFEAPHDMKDMEGMDDMDEEMRQAIMLSMQTAKHEDSKREEGK